MLMIITVILALGDQCSQHTVCDSCVENSCTWVLDERNGVCGDISGVTGSPDESFGSGDLSCRFTSQCPESMTLLETVKCGWEQSTTDYGLIASAFVENAHHITIDDPSAGIVKQPTSRGSAGSHKRDIPEVLKKLHDLLGVNRENLFDDWENYELDGNTVHAKTLNSNEANEKSVVPTLYQEQLEWKIPNLDEKVQAVLRTFQDRILNIVQLQLCPAEDNDGTECKYSTPSYGIKISKNQDSPNILDINHYRVVQYVINPQDYKFLLSWHVTMRLDTVALTMEVEEHNDLLYAPTKKGGNPYSKSESLALRKFIYPSEDIGSEGCCFDKNNQESRKDIVGVLEIFGCKPCSAGDAEKTYNSFTTSQK